MLDTKYEVIESRRWKHINGRTASFHGAVPWMGEYDKRDWHVEITGWTIYNSQTGTIGIGRVPFATEQEAQNWITKREAKRQEYFRIINA